MSDLSAQEMQRYNELTQAAAVRALSLQEKAEWGSFAARYAVQLEREGREYRERRAQEMKEFLAEKRAWSEARDAHNLAEAEKAKAHAEADPEAEAYVPQPFTAPEPIRDFNEWLQLKGKA